MISASTFAHKHTSFWRTFFPSLESYVRVVNAGAYERIYPDYEKDVESARSFIISETAFCLAAQKIVEKPDYSAAFVDAKKRLSGLPGTPSEIAALTPSEKEICAEWAARLQKMISIGRKATSILYNPEFPGCGALSRSIGDIRVDDTLVEVKCVDRTFRATDFRQLITYFFQNMEGGADPIKRLGILNPRRGIFFEEDAGQFIFDVSASDLLELQGRFRSAVCMAGVSR